MKFGQENCGILERIIRIILGGVVLTVAATQSPGSWSVWFYPLLVVGVILVITGLIGSCPMYTMFGVNTSETG